jgi:hypothetical protein
MLKKNIKHFGGRYMKRLLILAIALILVGGAYACSEIPPEEPPEEPPVEPPVEELVVNESVPISEPTVPQKEPKMIEMQCTQ